MNFRDKFIVYFIKPVGQDGPIKIGLSNDPARRIAEFATWSPLRLELLGSVPGSWADEQFMHECLADHLSHGEWFHASPEVLSAVNSVIATGGFDAVRQALTPKANLRSLKNRATRSRKAEAA